MNKNLLPLALGGGLAIGTTGFVLLALLPSIAQGFRVTIPEVGYVILAYALAPSLARRCTRCESATWPPSACWCA